MHFTLKQLEYFVVAAEHGNVSIAAKQLHVSQPSVSTAISLLEERFDLQLVHRHPAKGISLTNAGRAFTTEARSLLNQAKELSAYADDLSGSLSGSLDIGCFVTFAPFYLPGLLAKFKEVHPGIAINVIEDALDSLQEKLVSGAIEVALLYELGLSDEFATQSVASLPPYVLLSANHRLANRRSLSLHELAKEEFILLDLPHSRDYFISLFLRADVEPRIVHKTTSLEMVRGMVSRGLGYSILTLRPTANMSYDGT
ncbi:MAG: LysR family transcriptional regulator, partial [Pseudomonadales bacterium]